MEREDSGPTFNTIGQPSGSGEVGLLNDVRTAPSEVLSQHQPPSSQHVSLFPIAFALGRIISYLCISKGSTQVFLFFCFPIHQRTDRAKRADETGSFRLFFGPNELPSVAVLQGRSARVRKLKGRMGRMRRMELG